MAEEDAIFNITCLCSIGIPTTVVSAACGTTSNMLILLLLFKSKMTREPAGKIMVNEAMADILLNIFTGIMLWLNDIDRNIQTFGFPVVMGLSCVKAFSLTGMSTILCLAICRPLLFRTYVIPLRVNVGLATIWLCVPLMVGCAVFEDTFYERNEASGCVEPNYTYRNWWIGAGNVIIVLVVPVVVIGVCAVKIRKEIADEILRNGSNGTWSEGKIRLAKVTVDLFLLNVLSKIPFHVIAFLHVKSKPILGAVSLIYFMYSSAKLFLYLYMFHNFRRAAVRMFCCCRNMGMRPNRAGSRVTQPSCSVVQEIPEPLTVK